MSQKKQKGGQKASSGPSASDLVGCADPFLARLGRGLRTHEKKLEKITLLEAQVKSQGKQPDENQRAMLDGKAARLAEVQRDQEMASLYMQANPNWNKSTEELEAAAAAKATKLAEDRLRVAFGMFAGLHVMNDVRDHVIGNEDERAWLQSTLSAYDEMVADHLNPAAGTAFVDAMIAASGADAAMRQYVARASSQDNMAKARKAANPAPVKESVPAEPVKNTPAEETKVEHAAAEEAAANEDAGAATEEAAAEEGAQAAETAEAPAEEKKNQFVKGEARGGRDGQRPNTARDGERGGRGDRRGGRDGNRGGRGNRNYQRGPAVDGDGFQTAGEKPNYRGNNRGGQRGGRGGRGRGENYNKEDNGIREGNRRGGRGRGGEQAQTAAPAGDNNKANEGKQE